MNSCAPFLSPSEAARRLGVSAKALRLYERRGLVTPVRTAAGWRVYGSAEMARAAQIAALRSLGLSLAAVARVLDGDAASLDQALAAHQAALETQMRELSDAMEKIGNIRTDLKHGLAPASVELRRLLAPASEVVAAFDLPWPWGGERYEVRDVRALNYIIGPVNSGKTRLMLALAEALPDAAFVDLDRLADDGAAAQARLAADPDLKARVDAALAWLVDEGAAASAALLALLAALQADGPAFLVVDMLEWGLDHSSQEALIAWLRARGPAARPLFFTTRSSAILDLAAVGPGEAIILCPANHSRPTRVAPYPGAPGYEAVATCLASPEVRARSQGVPSWRPRVA